MAATQLARCLTDPARACRLRGPGCCQRCKTFRHNPLYLVARLAGELGVGERVVLDRLRAGEFDEKEAG
jgi:hypothetical protein